MLLSKAFFFFLSLWILQAKFISTLSHSRCIIEKMKILYMLRAELFEGSGGPRPAPKFPFFNRYIYILLNKILIYIYHRKSTIQMFFGLVVVLPAFAALHYTHTAVPNHQYHKNVCFSKHLYSIV
jgi:hypothetical protein